MNHENDAPKSPISVYQQIAHPRDALPATDGVLARFCMYLPDRPGSLAGFASAIAHDGGNISFFHYDRATESNHETTALKDMMLTLDVTVGAGLIAPVPHIDLDRFDLFLF